MDYGSTICDWVLGFWSPGRVIVNAEQVIDIIDFDHRTARGNRIDGNDNLPSHVKAFCRAFKSFLRGVGYPPNGLSLSVGSDLGGEFAESRVADDPGFRARLLCHALTGSPLLPLGDYINLKVS